MAILGVLGATDINAKAKTTASRLFVNRRPVLFGTGVGTRPIVGQTRLPVRTFGNTAMAQPFAGRRPRLT